MNVYEAYLSGKMVTAKLKDGSGHTYSGIVIGLSREGNQNWFTMLGCSSPRLPERSYAIKMKFDEADSYEFTLHPDGDWKR